MSGARTRDAHDVLRATKLTKEYDGLRALSDVHLRLPAGQLVALVGHNGAGKSTFLGLAAGLIEPTDGQVVVGGHSAGSLPARALLAYASDNPVLYDDLSVWEHLEYVAGLHGVDDWQHRGRHLIDVFELTERADDLPSRFSRGMRQKAALAVTLVRPAPVVLIDEPFVGLDMHAQSSLVEVLVERARSGSTIVVATHQPSFLAHVDRCIMLHDGRVTYEGPANERLLTALKSGEQLD
jgi:ABC-type multidrug transport system ATPase subunit